MRRIFVAIDISDEAREKVAARIAALRERFPKLRVGWERPEKLHLTLKFLGDTDDERLRSLIDSVAKTAKQIAPFHVSLTGSGAFPSERKARVLWIGVYDLENAVILYNVL
jgi:RNA 2',3'-cyclic 3'-phosphodiesterase